MGGADLVVDHCRRRCGCAKDKRRCKCDHGPGRHRRGSYFEMSMSAIEFAQMRRGVTCLEFTTTCSTRCQVWTNESLRAPNEVAAGRERRPHRRQSTRGVSPIQEPSLGRRSTLVAVGPVRRARRGNVAVTSVGQTRRSAAATRQSAAATRQSAAATVERRGGVRGFGAGRSGERSFPSPGVHGLRESRCS